MSENTFSAHYISGTHWDREWYRPFQEFRLLLVRLLDDLLGLMEREPEFKYFQLDGQTCILEDYMQIRPENRPRLEKLMHEGRILAGPWYTMPDLFCVGDEALIRNLLLGRRICHEWGVEPMPVGFICDMFGHPSQIAQIFKGFGLNDVVLGRGTNEHTTPTYFWWEAPDGSRAFTFKLQDSQGYGAFALPRTILEGPTFLMDHLADFGAEMRAAGDNADLRVAAQEKHFRIELAKYVNHETARANGSVVCLMDSMDHIAPATEVPRYLRLIEEATPNVKPQHSNLPAFFRDARAGAGDMPVKTGELREPAKTSNGYLWLIPNCVSARVAMKQANDRCQNLLEKWCEPLVAFANLQGANISERYLRVAWEHVLANHAHDSICGCSIDQVHRDMMYRFDQAEVLGEQLRSQALSALTNNAKELAEDKGEFTLLVFNPLPTAREEVVTLAVDLPLDWAQPTVDGFYVQHLKQFRLHDADGNEVPYQRLSFVPRTNERSRLAQFCFQSDGDFTRYDIAVKLSLPAFGYTALRVAPSQTAVRAAGTLRTGPTAAENEYLGIAIDSNGTLTLTDKATGETYTDLLTFEDRSEVGDGWFHGHSLNDEQILSAASRAQVAVVHDGPQQVTFRTTVTLDVPARYDRASEKGTVHTVPLVISSLVTLRRAARTVEIETTVENTAEDHRLRVLFPTDAVEATSYLAHHPYDFVERSITIDPQTASWQEMEQVEKPFLHMQSVGVGQRGLAFLSSGGLHEGGVWDDERRTLQVTLLRSFRKTVSTGGERDGLELGTLHYRYALMPFAGELPRTDALTELARLQSGVVTRQTGARPSGFRALTGAKTEESLLTQQTGALVISAIKPAESGEGLVLRLWNPTAQPGSETIHFARPVSAAAMLQLSEEPDPSLPEPALTGTSVEVQAGPHQIITVKVEFSS